MSSNLNREWGQRIRALRKQRGISLNRLARDADIDQSHLWKVERGTKGLGDQARIRVAAALGVRVEEIWSYPREVAS